MMTRTWLPASMLAMTLLAGCSQSQIPVARNFDYSVQHHMQAVQHWDVLAQAQAEAIAQQSQTFAEPLFLEPVSQDIPFQSAYRQMLTSRLLEQGVAVTMDDGSRTVLETDVQVVRHNARRPVRAARGSYTGQAAAAAAAGSAVNNWSEPGLIVFPALIAADLLAGRQSWETATELAVTSRVVEGVRVLYSKTFTYYVNGEDLHQYQADASNDAAAIRLTDKP